VLAVGHEPKLYAYSPGYLRQDPYLVLQHHRHVFKAFKLATVRGATYCTGKHSEILGMV